MKRDQEIRDAVRDALGDLPIDVSVLMAAIEVESGNKIFTEIDGKQMPLILFEYHVFYRNLRREDRAAAVASRLAAPRWGDIPYPRTQRERYELLAKASMIDAEAAHAACSWGVGQVLGENARWLGYENAVAMAHVAQSGLAGQVEIMLRFIERRGLVDALVMKDWAAFAHGYNGPLHARHDYAGRMARAYERISGQTAPNVLKLGDSGPAVAELQALLGEKQDGIFGTATEAAVRYHQRREGLKVDGIVGPETWASLRAITGQRPPAAPTRTGGTGTADKIGGGVTAIVVGAGAARGELTAWAEAAGIAPIWVLGPVLALGIVAFGVFAWPRALNVIDGWRRAT